MYPFVYPHGTPVPPAPPQEYYRRTEQPWNRTILYLEPYLCRYTHPRLVYYLPAFYLTVPPGYRLNIPTRLMLGEVDLITISSDSTYLNTYLTPRYRQSGKQDFVTNMFMHVTGKR